MTGCGRRFEPDSGRYIFGTRIVVGGRRRARGEWDSSLPPALFAPQHQCSRHRAHASTPNSRTCIALSRLGTPQCSSRAASPPLPAALIEEHHSKEKNGVPFTTDCTKDHRDVRRVSVEPAGAWWRLVMVRRCRSGADLAPQLAPHSRCSPARCPSEWKETKTRTAPLLPSLCLARGCRVERGRVGKWRGRRGGSCGPEVGSLG